MEKKLDIPMLWVLEQYQNKKFKEVDGIASMDVKLTYSRNREKAYHVTSVSFRPVLFRQDDAETLNELCMEASCTWRLRTHSDTNKPKARVVISHL